MSAPVDDDVTALVAQIKEAFQDVLRGEGVSLSETQVLDDYGGAEARQEARNWDTDTHWWEVSDEDLLDGHFASSYLDGLGWRYYLPAFMTHSLKIFSSPRTGITDTRSYTLEMLTYYDESDQEASARLQVRYPHLLRPLRADRQELGEREKQKWSILTTKQSQVICLYLRFVVAHSNESSAGRRSEKGLRQHWGQFCVGKAAP